MSIVTVQLGQCGNQLGSQLFGLLDEEVSEWGHERELFFRRDSGTERGIARTVLVDMEPKAVNVCLRKGSRPSANWAYDSKNVVIQQSGSGVLTPLVDSELTGFTPTKAVDCMYGAISYHESAGQYQQQQVQEITGL